MAEARYKQLVDELAAEIRAGRLQPGTRLPTHRRLAERHGLALVTASRVYAELEAMGLVSGEVGRGTFVREAAMHGGVGVDQRTMAPDLLDLNFNYPSLPGQAELLRAALRQLAAGGELDAMLRYAPMAAECMNAPASPGISRREDWRPSRRACCSSTAHSTGWQ
jgi:DNA-binding transcriptional regulator YhcF (GntR family)